MYLKKSKKPNGDIYLSIMEKYYDNAKKITRERTIKSIGCISKLSKTYNDPIAYFTNIAKEMTIKKQKVTTQTITIDTSEELTVQTDDIKNVGYGILKFLYRELDLYSFWSWKTSKNKIKFNLDKIFRLLVFSRALYPNSKKSTLETSSIYFEPFNDIELNDIYNALDIISEHSNALQKWIFEHSKNICDRDLSVSYFDCTNYYFDIGQSDVDITDDNNNPIDNHGNIIPPKYRKRGPEKNHRPDPIIGMGLLMDKNGIPIAYDLFPGNESEKLHLRPIVNRTKNDLDASRIIFVADRGLNTSDNIYWLNGDNRKEHNQRDGYVYGQSIRGADAEFKAWVLCNDYTISKIQNDDGNEIIFKHKSRIFAKQIQVNVTKPGAKKTSKRVVLIDQKQMIYYSEKYANKQRKERENMIARAVDLIKHPQKYNSITSKGSASYVVNIAFDKKTGEIINGKNLSLNVAKIKEEAKYDGYYSIVTSELNMSDFEMHKVYCGLAKIEDSFKITKTYFKSRPIYVRTTKHIEAHFATCFLALVLIRILELKLENKFPTGQILESLRKYNCLKIDVNIWQFSFFNNILKACADIFNIELNKKYCSQKEIKKILKY